MFRSNERLEGLVPYDDPGRSKLQLILDAIVRIAAGVLLAYALITDRQRGEWAQPFPDWQYGLLFLIVVGLGPDDVKRIVERIIMRFLGGGRD